MHWVVNIVQFMVNHMTLQEVPMYRAHKFIKMIPAVLCLLILLSFNNAALAETLTGKTNADKVFFRTKANTDCDYISKLDKGTKVALLDEAGGFYKVRFDSKTGFIMKKFLTVSDTAQKKLSKIAQPKSTSKFANISSIKALGDPPKMSRVGDKGEDVEKLQSALKIKKYYSGNIDGSFGKLTQDAMKNFQKKNNLDVSGEGDFNSILKLFGKVAQTTAANDPQMSGITKISQIKVTEART